MSSRKNSKDTHRNEKKAAVLDRPTPLVRPLTIVIMLLVVAIAGGTGYFLTQGHTAKPEAGYQPDNSSATKNRSEATYPVALFEDGKARHFQQRINGIDIRYFILKSSDGVIRVAFDACDVCWPAGKGYVQEGDEMICRNCGRRFASVLINEVKGGCNPAPLNRTVKNDLLIIKIDDILTGQTYFNFKKKA